MSRRTVIVSLLLAFAACLALTTNKTAASAPDGKAASEGKLQFEALKYDLRNRAHFAKVAAETYRPEALILESDRDPVDVVLRRTAALLADLKRMTSTPLLASLEKQLQGLEAANPQTAVTDADARFTSFQKACSVRRKIAFANPLLAFDKVLFIKRHRASFNHMCDQYYGINAVPGGARASKLYQMLKNGHNDVKLTHDEMHRITLWLDRCSVFYGVYERDGGQAQLAGKIVGPTLE